MGQKTIARKQRAALEDSPSDPSSSSSSQEDELTDQEEGERTESMGQKTIARKQRAALEDSPSDPSSSSSSQEDELTDQEEEENHYQEPPKETPESESSKDEEEQEVQEVEEKVEKTKPSVKKPITPLKPQHPQSSDSDPGSDSETHLGSPTASDFTKSVASMPKKPNSSKRLMQEFEKTANQAQKKKKAKVVEEEEKKYVGAINRLWSEKDEVLILKGLIDFQSKNGSDTYPDMGEFHELIKESLSVDVSKNQFVDKIRKLKRKYSINVEKAVFSRTHERKCFELSNKIWGGGKVKNGIDGNEKTVKLGDSVVAPKENEGKESALGDENKGGVDGNGKSSRSKRARKTDSVALPKGNGKEEVGLGKKLKGGKMKDMEVDEVGDFWAMHPCLKESLEMETETGMPSDLLRKNPVRRFLKENMSTIGNKKTMELEKKWKNLHAAEVTLALKRGELMNEQTKLVLDATNASKD
ncbi:hypothetical protein RHSIM_Rhsim11G0026100 [Rhododendron simsii]|uniref:Glabrous enhancer-binding protein-like DBD domain-containing protein n=1 Tax=Rhododendron simsii TaxID=118357 RepID=A0A834L7Q6_RHOSS|nr:hypothetical protein RHSIM_Rhsim11G0026100 [Rhododendron simsii]